MEFDLKRMETESQEQYFYRICKMKDSLGFTWPQMTEIFNDEFGCNKGDTAYRKEWAAFNKILNANIDKIVGNNAYLDEIKTATDEFYKAKKQFYDQRREYNKLLANDARSNHLMEKLVEAANQVPLKDYSSVLKFKNVASTSEEALLCISDWHLGMVSNNIWNEYNVDICIERVSKLFDKVVRILKDRPVSVLNIAILGDMINGAIHTTSRVASEENACEQLMDVSELLAHFINGVSVYVDKVNVYSTYGNHARTIQNKEDSIHSDNMERIIPWWLKQRLSNNTNVSIIDSEYYEFIYIQIYGYNVVCTHGDLDRFKDLGMTVNALFNKKYGKSIDYTFSADKHHTESFEQFGIESTLVGSLCGTDEYANNKRLYSNPMQTMCIFTPDDGKLCSYNIKL
jgi:hypothetical protein